MDKRCRWKEESVPARQAVSRAGTPASVCERRNGSDEDTPVVSVVEHVAGTGSVAEGLSPIVVVQRFMEPRFGFILSSLLSSF